MASLKCSQHISAITQQPYWVSEVRYNLNLKSSISYSVDVSETGKEFAHAHANLHILSTAYHIFCKYQYIKQKLSYIITFWWTSNQPEVQTRCSISAAALQEFLSQDYLPHFLFKVCACWAMTVSSASTAQMLITWFLQSLEHSNLKLCIPSHMNSTLS